jgi:hypothetical protein
VEFLKLMEDFLFFQNAKEFSGADQTIHVSSLLKFESRTAAAKMLQGQMRAQGAAPRRKRQIDSWVERMYHGGMNGIFFQLDNPTWKGISKFINQNCG